MTFRDYMGQVERDAREAIEEGAGWYDSWDEMYDALFVDDAVTGNGSGSYTFSTVKAAGYGIELFAESPETVDVIARCLALGFVFSSLEKAYGSVRASTVE